MSQSQKIKNKTKHTHTHTRSTEEVKALDVYADETCDLLLCPVLTIQSSLIEDTAVINVCLGISNVPFLLI